jgi:predicted RNA polymerase sigma factor
MPCIITRHGGLPEAGGRDALTCEPRHVSGLVVALQQAATMSEGAYQQRATRTKDDLANEIVPLSFYPDSYLRLCERFGGAP